jgi:succinate-acetate transporter protein
MSVLEQRDTQTAPVTGATYVNGGEPAFPTRIVLQPIAAPSVLGWFGFAGATFIVAAWMAGWYGSANTPDFLFPFAAVFGGLAQFLAAMWSYRARDVLATAMHGTWGSFWMGYGLLWAFFATGTLTQPSGAFTGLGYWFVALAVITASGAVAAIARSLSLFAILTALTAGARARGSRLSLRLVDDPEHRRLPPHRLGRSRLVRGDRDAAGGRVRPGHPPPRHVPPRGQRPGARVNARDRVVAGRARRQARPVGPRGGSARCRRALPPLLFTGARSRSCV